MATAKKVYVYARNTERSYYEVEAATEAEAWVMLTGGDPDEYRVGCRSIDTDEDQFELIDVEEED